jgi:hypothetical protein
MGEPHNVVAVQSFLRIAQRTSVLHDSRVPLFSQWLGKLSVGVLRCYQFLIIVREVIFTGQKSMRVARFLYSSLSCLSLRRLPQALDPAYQLKLIPIFLSNKPPTNHLDSYPSGLLKILGPSGHRRFPSSHLH